MSKHSKPSVLLAAAKATLELPAAAYRTQVAALSILSDVVEFLEKAPASATSAGAKIEDQQKEIVELHAAVELLRADLADANARLKQVNDVVDAAPPALAPSAAPAK